MRVIPIPPGWPIRMSGAGADGDADRGVQRNPVMSPRANSRSTMPPSRFCSEMKCMVEPFGSTADRRRSPDDLSPDRDSPEEHQRQFVHGYHLLASCTDFRSYQSRQKPPDRNFHAETRSSHRAPSGVNNVMTSNISCRKRHRRGWTCSLLPKRSCCYSNCRSSRTHRRITRGRRRSHDAVTFQPIQSCHPQLVSRREHFVVPIGVHTRWSG